MIGRGILLHNLYIFQPDSSPLISYFSGSLPVDGILWHQRLGYLSSDKLQIFFDTLSVSKSMLSISLPCSICPLAKQKKLPFESNNHRYVAPFDLVHLDV